MGVEEQGQDGKLPLTRRGVIAGAAWTVPAVVVTSAVPAFAVSKDPDVLVSLGALRFVDEMTSGTISGSDRWTGPSSLEVSSWVLPTTWTEGNRCFEVEAKLIPVDSSGNPVPYRDISRATTDLIHSRGIHPEGKGVVEAGKMWEPASVSSAGVITYRGVVTVGGGKAPWGLAIALKAPRYWKPLYKSTLEIAHVDCSSHERISDVFVADSTAPPYVGEGPSKDGII